MNDKAFERAKIIKKDLAHLATLKSTLEKCKNISIDISKLECVRQPFIEAVKVEIAKLQEEYKSL